MADKDLRVHLKADDDISKAAKSAKSELERIPDKVETKLDVDTSALDALPGQLGDIAGLMTGPAGIAAGAAAGAAAINDLAQGFADAAIQARVTADLTGATIEDASRLQAVWKQSGADVNDLNDVLLQMNGVLQTSPEMAKQIGVNLQDGADIGSRFVEIVGKIQSSTLGASDKAQLMSQMFGEEGVRQVAKLTASIDGPLSQAIADVSEAQVIDEEEERRAKELTVQTRKLNSEWQNLKMTLGEIVVGPVTTSIEKSLGMVEAAKAIFGGDWGRVFDTSGTDEWRDSLEGGVKALEAADFAGGEFVDTSDDMTDSTKQHARSQEDAARAVDQHVERIKRLAEEQKRAAAGAAAFNAAVSGMEWGATEYQGALTAMSAFSDQLFALDRAQAAWETSMIAMNEAITENGFNFDNTTEAGRKNQAALEGIAGVLDEQLATAYDQADGDMGTFKATADKITSDTLGRLQDELGLSAEETNALADELGLLPEDIETRYKLSGDEEAKAKIGLLQGSIDALPKNVQTKVTQQIITGDYQGALATIQGYYNSHPATVKVIPVVQATRGLTGGIVGGATPAAMTATATAATTATQPVPVGYAAVPSMRVAVPAPTPLTFNIGVMGNRFDSQRAITKALRAHQRLNGERP